MRLKRLELQGFKSFVNRTILHFEPGLTGVVGPNGCGKSNLVDAIVWVLGEQRPTQLRGDSMTDVIFNGSDSVSPASFAEVTLILDRQGVALNSQFLTEGSSHDEMAVTRRVGRDGKGEFFINKVACRLKDIHELFMDTGLGRSSYSIIEQGQMDQIIQARSEERRALFEEVAGVTKYKVKKHEAERKLEQAQSGLLRVTDRTNEMEKQIRSLRQQAARAEKYRSLKRELEVVDKWVWGSQYRKAGVKLAQLDAEKPKLKAALDALSVLVEKAEEKAKVLANEKEQLLPLLQAKQEAERTWLLKGESEKQACALLEQEKEFLEREFRQNRERHQGLVAELEVLQQRIGDLEGTQQELRMEHERLVEVRERSQGDVASLLEKKRTHQRELASRKQVAQETDAQLSKIEEELAPLQGELVRLQEKRAQLEGEHTWVQQQRVACEQDRKTGESKCGETRLLLEKIRGSLMLGSCF